MGKEKADIFSTCRLLNEQIMDFLNEYQKKAAEYKGKHLLVLAGAGTGKTRTIIARAAYLIKTGIKPNRIAILSFTRKSAGEIAERVKSSLTGDFDTKGVTGKTFHSWCNEILHIYPDYFPQSKFTLLDEDDRNSAMGLSVGKKFRDSQGEKLNAKTVVKIYSFAVNTLCSLSEAIRHARYSHSEKKEDELKKIIEQDKLLIAPVIRQYIEFKKKRHYIDYDDMLNIVADALQKDKNIRDKVTHRWQHILVDETQDTNPLQYKLLRSFVEKSHLFCVGDDAQSIYAFRGADFRTIHSFSDIIPESETFKLLLNYRSTQEILDLSNWLLAQSPLHYDKKLEAFRGSGRKPELIHVDNDWDEANVITDDILDSVTERGERYADTMVLGRSGWALAQVEGACLQKKIPYRKLGGTSLMQSAHVRDVVAAMRIVANNYDEIAWIRFLKLWDGIGDVTASRLIADIITLGSFDDILDYLKMSPNKNVTAQIPGTLRKINTEINFPSGAMKIAVELMEPILSKTYREEWEFRKGDFLVLEEVAKSTGSISEFVTEYVLDPRAETTLKIGVKETTDVVTLSTIHSAKGLEAKTVHVLDVNPYSYPTARDIYEGEDAIEEERRCLYVALTRAKDNLKIYRNVRSLHTQYPETSDKINIGKTYKPKNSKAGEVVVTRKDGEKVFVVTRDGDALLEYNVTEFGQKFEKVNPKDKTLYFLNHLPIDLVEMVVPNGDKMHSAEETSAAGTADFPDFDFG